MTRDEVLRLRREKVVKLLRRRRIVLEMRRARATRSPVVSDELRKMQDNLLKATVPGQQSTANPRAGMDRLLAKLDNKPAQVDLSKFDPKVKSKKKQIRVIVDALGKGCEQCLARPAVIYNFDYTKYLCLDCEEMLILDTAGAVFDRLNKKKTGG